jgi:hypothetical protein
LLVLSEFVLVSIWLVLDAVELVESLANSMSRIDLLNHASVDTNKDAVTQLVLSLPDDYTDGGDHSAAGIL